MQIGGRNGTNMPFARKNRKSWSLPVFSSPKAVLLGKIVQRGCITQIKLSQRKIRYDEAEILHFVNSGMPSWLWSEHRRFEGASRKSNEEPSAAHSLVSCATIAACRRRWIMIGDLAWIPDLLFANLPIWARRSRQKMYLEVCLPKKDRGRVRASSWIIFLHHFSELN